MRLVLCLYFLMSVVLSGCISSSVSSQTSVPPLTIAPPPTLTFAGDCNVSRDLANWLEFSTFYVTEFTELISSAAAKNADEMYSDVVMMGRMREDFSRVATPNCAQEAQQAIIDAMSSAVRGFQAYTNHDSDSFGSTVAEVFAEFDQVTAMQNDLTTRLEAQLQAQQNG